MVAMGKVEAGDRQASLNQFFQLRHFPTGRTQGTDNFGFACGGIRLGQDLIQGNIATPQFRTDRIQLRRLRFQRGRRHINKDGFVE